MEWLFLYLLELSLAHALDEEAVSLNLLLEVEDEIAHLLMFLGVEHEYNCSEKLVEDEVHLHRGLLLTFTQGLQRKDQRLVGYDALDGLFAHVFEVGDHLDAEVVWVIFTVEIVALYALALELLFQPHTAHGRPFLVLITQDV